MKEYAPHAKQVLFHTDPRPVRWFCAGYGTGKTTSGVMEAFANATMHHPGYIGIVSAPTYPLLFQAWFTEWCQWIPQEYWNIRKSSTEGAEITVRTAEGALSRILLRSTSNPGSNEGVNAAWLVFDEASREPKVDAYNVLVARLRRGYPGRQRTQAFTGPPGSKQHWTAKEFGTGPSGTREGSSQLWGDSERAVIRARTRDNPHLPVDYESKLRARPGATESWCKQFLDAEFGAQEGQVYSSFTTNIHVVPHDMLRNHRYSIIGCGVDWGYTHPGAMIVGGLDALGDLYVLAEEVHSGRPISTEPNGWVTIGVELCRREKVRQFHCDPSGPGAMRALADGLRGKGGAQVYGADNDVGEGIRRLIARMEWAVLRSRGESIERSARGQHGPAIYISDRCPKLIACLEDYSRKRGRDGLPTEQPVKLDDDPADALRYLVMGLTKP